MAVGRWVVVSSDTADKLIKGGPYLWDPPTAWQPPEGGGAWATAMVTAGTLLEEAPARADGYTYPPPPPPESQNWVTVDHETLTITGGPYWWNGTGTPPAPGDLMTENDAVGGGYTWP